MIDARTFDSRNQALQRTLQNKLGVKSRSLPQALRRAGRRLPRRLRKEGAFIVQSQKLAANPKLARQIKPAEVDRAYAAITTHLDAIDVADVRKGKWLNMAGTVSLNLLVVAVAFVIWLWWRGYV